LLSHVNRTYRLDGLERRAVEDLTLQFDEGSCVAIMGANGCGKSTALRIILGLEQPDSGCVGVRWSGYASSDDDFSVPLQARFGTVIQQQHSRMLLPNVSVCDNVLLPIGGAFDEGLSPKGVLDQFTAYLAELGYDISLRALGRTLSGGQQQAVVLARALVYAQRLLIWDEPTSWLDMHKRRGFYRLLAQRRAELSLSVILVTHEIEEALLLADRVLVFDSPMKLLADVHVQRIAQGLDLTLPDSPAGTEARRKIREAILGAPDAPSFTERRPGC